MSTQAKSSERASRAKRSGAKRRRSKISRLSAWLRAFRSDAIVLERRDRLCCVDRLSRHPNSDIARRMPTLVELVINIKTAKALDLTVPLSLLGRADELID